LGRRPRSVVRRTGRGPRLGSALLRSDLVFQWYLQPADGGGTIISVHVDIPEAEAERLEMQRNVIESSLRRLGKLAAAD